MSEARSPRQKGCCLDHHHPDVTGRGTGKKGCSNVLMHTPHTHTPPAAMGCNRLRCKVQETEEGCRWGLGVEED